VIEGELRDVLELNSEQASRITKASSP